MEIEYIDSCHVYLIDGVIALSVTQIISKLFPNTYENIPKYILDKSIEFGNSVHKMIEDYEKGEKLKLNPLLSEILDGYNDICGDNEIEVLKMEQLVHYKDRYCGRYDMMALVNGKKAIIDIKTTSKVHEDMLSWQLGMYKLAVEECEGFEIEETYCLWLSKKNAPKLIKISYKGKEEIEDMLNEIDYAE